MLLFRSIRSARLVLARPGGYQTASASRKFQSRDTSIHHPFLLRSRSENSTRTWRRTPILVPMVSDGWKGGQLGMNNLAMMPMSKNLDNLEKMVCPENVALVPRPQSQGESRGKMVSPCAKRPPQGDCRSGRGTVPIEDPDFATPMPSASGSRLPDSPT